MSLAETLNKIAVAPTRLIRQQNLRLSVNADVKNGVPPVQLQKGPVTQKGKAVDGTRSRPEMSKYILTRTADEMANKAQLGRIPALPHGSRSTLTLLHHQSMAAQLMKMTSGVKLGELGARPRVT
jgi:hypothetical protein